jgi:hypothetical protein
MHDFALVTWNRETITRYETLKHRTVEESLAFAEGMITERINPTRNDQAPPGTTYVIEVGHRDIAATPHYLPAVIIGTWHITGEADRPVITWQAKIHGSGV